jgi:hypothetical protein
MCAWWEGNKPAFMGKFAQCRKDDETRLLETLVDWPNDTRKKYFALVTLTFLSSSLSWLSAIMQPGLDLPLWVPLTCISVSAALSGLLDREHWGLFVNSCVLGALCGFSIGFAIWHRLDKAAVAIPIIMVLGIISTLAVALVGGLVGSRLSVQHQAFRNAAWFALAATTLFGPTRLVITPALVARRVAHNQQVALYRFTSLQKAVEQTFANSINEAERCDGSLLAKSYAGPPFTEEDWQRITGNYV